MSKPAIKRIREKALLIKTAWEEGAPDVTEFRNTKKVEFDAAIAEGQASENRIAQLKAELSLEETKCDTIYTRINAYNVDIRKGVEGHKDYGDDSPLIGTMGFVRKSDRDSGLTRDTKATPNGEGEST